MAGYIKKNRKWTNLIKYDFDYCYLLELEYQKIKKMRKYFNKSRIDAMWSFTVRDLDLCMKLIDIIAERDSVTRTFTDIVTSNMNIKFEKIPDTSLSQMKIEDTGTVTFPRYVNERNEKRFFRKEPIAEQRADTEPYRGEYGRSHRIGYLQEELRRRKALHLYNLIREYRMYYWWD